MNYINPNHRLEWQQSGVLEALINLNVSSVRPGYTAFELLDFLHKSEKGEAFADKTIDFSHKSKRQCFTPTLKYLDLFIF